MVYAAHILVIYGKFWHEQSLSFYYAKTFGVLECILGTLVLAIVMIGAAIIWDWLKQITYHLHVSCSGCIWEP